MELKVGDTVSLKSGGPVMTILEIFKSEDGAMQAICKWFVKGNLEEAVFPLAALKKDIPPFAGG